MPDCAKIALRIQKMWRWRRAEAGLVKYYGARGDSGFSSDRRGADLIGFGPIEQDSG